MTFRIVTIIMVFLITFRLCVLALPFLNEPTDVSLFKGVEYIGLAIVCWVLCIVIVMRSK
jgi:hypothetical protein